MQDFPPKPENMEHINKLFDCIRLIDIESTRLLQEYFTYTEYNSAFDYTQRQHLYKQCLESDCAIYRINQEGSCLLIYAIFPACIENKKYVFEGIVNATERLDVNQCFTLSDAMHRLLITDDVTGIYNRRYINQTLPHAVFECAKREIPLSVIFTDLDFFKMVNDLHGHECGDFLLCEFAKELQKNLETHTGWVARYGGDEFLICMIDVDYHSAKEIAERIRTGVEKKSFAYYGHEITSTCSLGVHTIDDFQQLPSYDSILREVDVKLYEAKRSGRNTVK